MLTLLAPAKLNLTLEVLAERPDGFHEIRSLLQTITLGDSFRFRLSPDVTFKCDLPGWIAEESLVSRAVSLLRETTGTAKGVSIELSKRIPLLSGLGGDSSDAAAVLCGLNQLWGLRLSPDELLNLAQRLGSDVAFFLYGGTALVEGRGERVTPLPALPHLWVILVVPPVPRLSGKTKQLYASLNATDYTDGQVTQKAVETLKAGKDFTPCLLFNTFEKVAFNYFPKLSLFQEEMKKAGASEVHLAGSGPALFTLIEDKSWAEEVYLRLKQRGLESYLAETKEK